MPEPILGTLLLTALSVLFWLRHRQEQDKAAARRAGLVKSGKVYDLGQVYERGMPLFGDRTHAMFIPGAPTCAGFGKNDLIGNDELLCTETGQAGTQFDGLVADKVSEFVFVFALVPFEGATGPPGRPIAIR